MSLFDLVKDAPAVSLANILPIEDAPDLLALHCPRTGIPIWPNIRVAFFRQIMADLLFPEGSVEPPAARRSWRSVGTLGRATAHNAARVAVRALRSDVLINTEAIGDELRDGVWFNRYVDPFGDLPSRQAVVMTDMFEWQWHRPRHNERIFYHAPIQVGAALLPRLRPSAPATALAEAATALACDRAHAVLGWKMRDETRAAFVQRSARKVAALPFRYGAYRRLLRRVRPRLLLGSSGCYGLHAALIAAARDLGVVTAEYQHGAISGGHDAYNFAPAVFASEAYRRTLPQYLLTYGDWWGDQINAPVETVAIGYPARATTLDQLTLSPTSGRRTVLLLSDGIQFDLYLGLARAIAAGVGDLELEVVLRPHPMERTFVQQTYGDMADGIRIDTVPDIYASFFDAHTIVSEVSTGLFEAVGLVERIVLLNTARARFAYPDYPFAAADSAKDVIDLIRGTVPAMTTVDAAALWAPNWQENYRRFLAEKVGING